MLMSYFSSFCSLPMLYLPLFFSYVSSSLSNTREPSSCSSDTFTISLSNFGVVNGIEFCGVFSKYSSELVKLAVYGL